MTIEAIVLDLDGTTLNEINTVNETLIQYIGELRERGKLVFIATGRTLEELKDVVPSHMLVDAMVTANGMSAFIEGNQIIEHALPPQLVERLVAKAGAEEMYYEVHPNDGARMTLKKIKAIWLNKEWCKSLLQSRRMNGSQDRRQWKGK